MTAATDAHSAGSGSDNDSEPQPLPPNEDETQRLIPWQEPGRAVGGKASEFWSPRGS